MLTLCIKQASGVFHPLAFLWLQGNSYPRVLGDAVLVPVHALAVERMVEDLLC